MNDNDEIPAALAGLGTRLETRMDVMAKGTGRIEADVAQFRVDIAAYRLESTPRLTVREETVA